MTLVVLLLFIIVKLAELMRDMSDELYRFVRILSSLLVHEIDELLWQIPEFCRNAS
jgi:hypothetical protein